MLWVWAEQIRWAMPRIWKDGLLTMVPSRWQRRDAPRLDYDAALVKDPFLQARETHPERNWKAPRRLNRIQWLRGQPNLRMNLLLPLYRYIRTPLGVKHHRASAQLHRRLARAAEPPADAKRGSTPDQQHDYDQQPSPGDVFHQQRTA